MAFPDIQPNSIGFNSIVPTIVTQTKNGVEQLEQSSGQFWTLNLEFINLTQIEQRELIGFYLENQGAINSFQYTLPDYLGNSTGTSTANMTTTSSSSAGEKVLRAVPIASGTNPLYRAGDLVKLGGHSKVYMITENITRNESEISIFPPLRANVSAGENILFRNIPMTVRFANPNQSVSIRPSELSDFIIELREVLS